MWAGCFGSLQFCLSVNSKTCVSEGDVLLMCVMGIGLLLTLSLSLLFRLLPLAVVIADGTIMTSDSILQHSLLSDMAEHPVQKCSL